jgi:hypothetical protein
LALNRLIEGIATYRWLLHIPLLSSGLVVRQVVGLAQTDRKSRSVEADVDQGAAARSGTTRTSAVKEKSNGRKMKFISTSGFR